MEVKLDIFTAVSVFLNMKRFLFFKSFEYDYWVSGLVGWWVSGRWSVGQWLVGQWSVDLIKPILSAYWVWLWKILCSYKKECNELSEVLTIKIFKKCLKKSFYIYKFIGIFLKKIVIQYIFIKIYYIPLKPVVPIYE